jgi:hypothetical protein
VSGDARLVALEDSPAGRPEMGQAESRLRRPMKAELAREWRQRNPDKVREYNERRRTPPTESVCVECGATIVGAKGRLLCGARRCKDARYRRLHPEASRAKQRRKDERRRAAKST